MGRVCPNCGGSKAAVALTELRPIHDGDYGVCGTCESVLRVTGEDAQPVLVTNEEISNLSPGQLIKLAAAKLAIRNYKRQKAVESAKRN